MRAGLLMGLLLVIGCGGRSEGERDKGHDMRPGQTEAGGHDIGGQPTCFIDFPCRDGEIQCVGDKYMVMVTDCDCAAYCPVGSP